MRSLKYGFASSLFLSLLLHCSFAPRADAYSEGEDPLQWAYGWTVDSITVSGVEETKPFVVLREMETRVGDVLNRTTLERDRSYLQDLGIFASIEISADSVGFARCALRISVRERSVWFVKSIVPILDYDWEERGFSYGLKWDDRNFRGRNERLGVSFKRDPDNNDNVSFGWYAPWLGWRHIGLGVRYSYYKRRDAPKTLAILRRHGQSISLAIPLTESRMSLAQAIGSVSIEEIEEGKQGGGVTRQTFVSPLLGLRLDNRDSPLKPRHGRYFLTSILLSRSVSGERILFYRLFNDIRYFHPLSKRLVLAAQSNLLYQFGQYPEYATVRLGGAGTIRGYPDGKYAGFHRWFKTLECRYALFPREVFRIPYLGFVDIGLFVVAFCDVGIVWESEEQFNTDRYHGGAGIGFRLYSPYQDAVRFDLGFNRRGDVFPYINTSIRF